MFSLLLSESRWGERTLEGLDEEEGKRKLFNYILNKNREKQLEKKRIISPIPSC